MQSNMSTVTVYNNDNELSRANIFHQFHIKETLTGELYWFEDFEPEQQAIRQIWIQAIAFDPMISTLLPEWQLIINGVWMEKKLYNIVEHLKGKEVELRYKNYRFVFQFDS